MLSWDPWALSVFVSFVLLKREFNRVVHKVNLFFFFFLGLRGTFFACCSCAGRLVAKGLFSFFCLSYCTSISCGNESFFPFQKKKKKKKDTPPAEFLLYCLSVTVH